VTSWKDVGDGGGIDAKTEKGKTDRGSDCPTRLQYVRAEEKADKETDNVSKREPAPTAGGRRTSKGLLAAPPGARGRLSLKEEKKSYLYVGQAEKFPHLGENAENEKYS